MTDTLTPSGIAIRYEEKPRRQYSLRVPAIVEMAWRPVPSVTEVLRILDKPALKWWAMTTGIDGFIELIDRYAWRTDGLPDKLTTTKVVELFKREKLTVNSVSGKAADRGKAAHTALERLVETGEVPDAREFPPADRGFVKGLTAWHEEYQPEVALSEVMVGSAEHGFAGRFDLLARIQDELWLLDLKTTGKAPPRVYDEALLQVAAYSLACEESGHPAPDKKAILCLSPDGQYVVKESLCAPEHFLSVLAAWRAVGDVKAIHEAVAA